MTKQTEDTIEIKIETIYDLLECQRQFQLRLNNDVPQYLVTTFAHVQNSILQNVYQAIEFQEFIEAEFEDDRKEELIDYLLFTLNKYIYLMDISIEKQYYTLTYLEELFVTKSEMSIAACDSYASLEQNSYISLLRNHCTFKPWKIHGENQNCADESKVRDALDKALFYLKQMIEIVFEDYDEFKRCLFYKIEKNIVRQIKGY